MWPPLGLARWSEQFCHPDPEDNTRPARGTLSDNPQVEALLQGILRFGPAAWFLFIAPLRIARLRGEKLVVARNRRLYFKAPVAILICSLQLIAAVYGMLEHAPWSVLAPRLLFWAADAVSCVLLFFEHGRNTGPSTVLTLYLVLTIFNHLVNAGLKYVAWNLCDMECIPIAIFSSKVLLLILESQVKRSILRPPHDQLSAEETSGLFGTLFLWWVNTVLSAGYSSTLRLADMPPLNRALDAVQIRATMQREWDKKRKHEGRYNLLLALLKSSWRPNIAVFLPRVLCTVLRCCQPILISRAITFVGSEQAPFENRNEAFRLMLLTILIYAGIPIFTGVYLRILAQVTIVGRMALVGIIYKDCLNVKDRVDDKTAAVTLMSVDADSAAGCWDMFHDFWSQMLEAAIGMYMLAGELGWICLFPLLVVVDRQVEFSRATQARISATKAVLDSMKNIKMMGLVEKMETRIQGQRDQELKKFVAFYRLLVVYFVSSVALHLFSPAITLIFYAIQAQIRGLASVDTNMIFTSLAIINLIAAPANSLLGILPELASVLAAFDRIQTHLVKPNYEDKREFLDPGSSTSGRSLSGAATSCAPTDDTAIRLEQVGIRPALTSDLVLENISTTWKKGDLIVISGSVGTGKTSLVRALLGELPQDYGVIKTAYRTAAYCSQTAWLSNGTVQEAICGPLNNGRVLDDRQYTETLRLCDLNQDLYRMLDGDQTIIGSRGIALSGGQKQRLTLARAIFAGKELVILDDTFSALDVSTQCHITNKLMRSNGIFKKRGATVILITHSTEHLALADHIVILDSNGGIAEQGTWKDLRSGTGYTSKLAFVPENEQADKASRDGSNTSDSVQTGTKSPDDLQQIDHGTSDTTLYKYYFSAIGISRMLVLVASLLLYACFVGIIPYWLKWMGESGGSRMWFYTTVYLLLAIGGFLSIAAAVATIFLAIAPHSGNALHRRLLRTVMRAPQSYFATTDTGVTLNRFSSDIMMIDRSLPFALFQVFQAVFLLLSQCVILTIAQPIIAVTLPFTSLAVYLVQKIYLATSRQLRCLDLDARALVSSSFLETIEGAETIRAFGWQQAFDTDNARKLDLSLRPDYMLTCVQRWLDLVLDFIVLGLAICIVGLSIALKDSTTGGQIGLALNVVLQANQYILRLVSAWTGLETSLGAISRVRGFERDVQPEERAGDKVQPPSNWPATGAVEFSNVSASYEDTVLALESVTVTIPPGAKVGVVGRTGSGKTSLLLSLLRLVELQDPGKVKVDGLDIANLQRNAVRSRLITIPQDPMLVKTDTVRQNLDIADADVADEEMVRILEDVGLWRVFVERRIESASSESPVPSSGTVEDEGLDTSSEVSYDGQAAAILDLVMESVPLSQGQEQLFSLARALLMRRLRGNIVLLDEATSSVDANTNQLMQAIVREAFSQHTVITVAHRLDTIMDSDLVLVMNSGKLVEAGPPSELLQKEDGFFRALQAGSGGIVCESE
ncbi:hypothetical protein PWT90_06528 [Aphanocladium album]|nr:hypothetical protein PWT90_06528 [Aphanocladium album]